MRKIIFVFISLFFVSTHAQECPQIEAIMVDACGTEPLNEFVIISTGDGFQVDDLQFGFHPTNTGGGAQNGNINVGFISCGLTAGNADVYTGCNNIISVGPGDSVPADAYLVLQSSNGADASYDFSELCEDDACIYVVANSCTRTSGAFTNKDTSSPGIRNNTLALSGTSCQDVATFDTDDLISNADGNYFIPPATYGISSPNPCVAPPIPPAQGTIPVFDEFDPICAGEDSPLPTTSNNGVNGEWIPVFNNQETTTYTFIPDEETCGTDVEVTIEVIPNELPEFSFETELCENQSDFPDLPTVSDNGVEGVWLPEEISEEDTEYVFTPSSTCSEEITIQITFEAEEEPVFDIPNEICEGVEFNLPLISENGISGSWTPDFDPENSGSYTFTPESEFCASSIVVDIEITSQNLSSIESQIPEDIELECNLSLPEVPEIELTDVCGVTDLIFEETSEIGTCPVVEIVIRTWEVLDENNNALASYSQTISLVDTQPPFFTVLPSDEVLSCDADWPEDAEVQAEDDCSEVNISIEEEVIEDPDCPQNFTLVRTFVAIDDCGNAVEEQQVVEFIDDEGPEFDENLPSSVQVECGDVPQPQTPQVFDACGEVAELTFTENVLDNCEEGKITEHIWEATDNCGNTSTYILEIIEECFPIVYEGISPNNDGINDFLEIENLDCFPENNFKVFNRYGKQVFETRNYDNQSRFFDGSDQSGNELVTGTYFYVFNYTNPANGATKTEKGWIYVNRESN